MRRGTSRSRRRQTGRRRSRRWTGLGQQPQHVALAFRQVGHRSTARPGAAKRSITRASTRGTATTPPRHHPHRLDSSAGGTRLSTKPEAPARIASKTYSSTSNVVSTSTLAPRRRRDVPRRLQSVHVRHADVHQHQVGPVLGHHGERLARRRQPRPPRPSRALTRRSPAAPSAPRGRRRRSRFSRESPSHAATPTARDLRHRGGPASPQRQQRPHREALLLGAARSTARPARSTRSRMPARPRPPPRPSSGRASPAAGCR